MSRYGEMINWSVIQFLFSVIIVLLYFFLSVKEKKDVIRVGVGKQTYYRVFRSDSIILCILVMVIGVRCNCGSDYYNYYERYNVITKWYNSLWSVMTSRFQCGYDTLAYIVKTIIGGKYTIFIVVAFLIYYPTIKLIRKKSSNPVISLAVWVFLGYLSMSTNIVKQSFAMVIVLYAYDAIEKRKYLQAFILCALACIFHLSSVYVCVILFLAKRFRPTRKFFFCMAIWSLFLMIIIRPFLRSLSFIIPVRYQEVYVNGFLINEVNDFKLTLGGITVAIFFIVLIFFITGKAFNKKIINSYYERMASICVFSLPWLFWGMRYYIMNRVAYECLIFMILLIPKIYDGICKKKKNIMIVSLCLYSIVTSILCAENNYYNYSTIFNDQPVSVQGFVQRGSN